LRSEERKVGRTIERERGEGDGGGWEEEERTERRP